MSRRHPPSLSSTIAALAVLAAVAAATVGCTDRMSTPDASTFQRPMSDYLAARGRLCLAKTAWPIDVTQHEVDIGARNALQMPVLERLGLVSSSVAEIDVDDEGTLHHMKVRRFALTDAGRPWYVARTPLARPALPVSDFCAATLSLDRVVAWDVQKSAGHSPDRAVVTYTYKVDAAPWTADAGVQKVFPMVAGIVHGAGKTELQESFVRTSDRGWVAVDLAGA